MLPVDIFSPSFSCVALIQIKSSVTSPDRKPIWLMMSTLHNAQNMSQVRKKHLDCTVEHRLSEHPLTEQSIIRTQ